MKLPSHLMEHLSHSGLRLNLSSSQEPRHHFVKSESAKRYSVLMSKANLISNQCHGDPVLERLLFWAHYYLKSLTSGPSKNGHFERTVGCQKSGLQGQVGHRTGAALRVDPALNGLPFIRVAICRRKTRRKCFNSKQNPQSSRYTDSQTLTGSDHWLLHDLACDWTEVLVGNAVRDRCHF